MDGATYICIKPFHARLGDELSLKIGDKIQVLADDREYNDGWYMGKNLLTGEAGLYPKTFTELLEKTEEKTLLRSRSRRVMTPPNKNNSQNNLLKETLNGTTGGSGNDGSNGDSSQSSSHTPNVSSNLNPYNTDQNSKLYNNSNNSSSNLNSEIDKALEELQLHGSTSSLQNENGNGKENGKENGNQNGNVNKDGNKYNNQSSNTNELKSKVANVLTSSAYTSTLSSSKNNVNNHNNSNNNNSNSNGNPHSSHNRNTSTQSMTDDLNPLQAMSWTPKQVSSYFALVLGFDKEVAGKFAKHKITGPILFELDLGHLKELEIDSFGTRFEIHKEIEKLREINLRSAKFKESRTSSQSTSSTNKNDQSQSTMSSSPTESTPYHEEEKFKLPKISTPNDSQSMYPSLHTSTFQNELMPSAFDTSTSTVKHQRKRSQSVENLPLEYESSFMSPRKAPEPPSSNYSPLDTSYKFGAGTNSVNQQHQNQHHHGLYTTRTNASSHALGHTPISRPASSIYDQGSHHRQSSQTSNYKQHHRKQSSVQSHRRHSSLLSFLPNGNDDSKGGNLNGSNTAGTPIQTHPASFAASAASAAVASSYDNKQHGKANDNRKLISPAQIRRENGADNGVGNNTRENNGASSPRKSQIFDVSRSPVDIDDATLSPKKKSASMKNKSFNALKDDRRVASEPQSANLSNARPSAMRLKSLRTTSTQNFKNLTGSKKLKTSAFTEGIREVTPNEATKTANYSGYMAKRSGNTVSWRSRYFTLHGTRLSYFTSFKDKKEKGLIDITAHNVVPINSESEDLDKSDRYAAMCASTTFAGNYCFKIVPPAPGFKKGLTFTQPKTHYFAVESEEEMRGWIKALMTATIDIDDSVPVVSSCSTPTVSLSKAQELLAKAREENKLKDEELRAKGYIRGDEDFEASFQSTSSTLTDAHENLRPNLTVDTRRSINSLAPPPPMTPLLQRSGSQSGFASPYLLASGYMSPKSASPGNTPAGGSTSPGYFVDPQPAYASLQPAPSRHASTSAYTKSSNRNHGDLNTLSTNPYSTASSLLDSSQADSTNNARTPEESKSRGMFASHPHKTTNGSTPTASMPKKQEKMMAFSSDGSGNHTFVIKSKK